MSAPLLPHDLGEPRPTDDGGGWRTTYHVAVVHGPCGVEVVAIASSPAEREGRVAQYVRRQADARLAPGTRALVRDLLARGALADAIRSYFEAVGNEWEHEWLHLQTVHSAPAP